MALEDSVGRPWSGWDEYPPHKEGSVGVSDSTYCLIPNIQTHEMCLAGFVTPSRGSQPKASQHILSRIPTRGRTR